MTTLSTHDTKRSEDVRARLAVLSELPDEWADTVRALREAQRRRTAAPSSTAGTELLVWQTLVGTWPISADRLEEYVEKVDARGQAAHARWTAPDAATRRRCRTSSTGLLADPRCAAADALDRARRPVRSAPTTLGQKLLQLVAARRAGRLPGLRVVALTLVDPDNRRPVDHADLAARLAGSTPAAGRGGPRPGEPSCWSPRGRCGCGGTTRTGSSVRRRPTPRSRRPAARPLAVARGDADGSAWWRS